MKEQHDHHARPAALISLTQAAAYLGISQTTLRRLVAANKIAYRQESRHTAIKFRPEWLDEYIDVKRSPVVTVTKPASGSKRKWRAATASARGDYSNFCVTPR